MSKNSLPIFEDTGAVNVIESSFTPGIIQNLRNNFQLSPNQFDRHNSSLALILNLSKINAVVFHIYQQKIIL